MAAARGETCIRTGLRYSATLLGGPQNVAKRWYRENPPRGRGAFNFNGNAVSSYVFESRRAKRPLLLPLPSLVDAKIVYTAVPAQGHHQKGHVERRSRVLSVMKAIQASGLADEARSGDVVNLGFKGMAAVEDVTAVHAMSYVMGLRQMMGKAQREKLVVLDEFGPTYATQDTYREAMMAAGACLAVVDHVLAAARETATPPVGFALVRPPGLHALPTKPMGSCLFGNVALAAKHVQKAHGLRRVFIIDFGSHHGNGTSSVFYGDPNVFYLSTHEIGGFPGTGKMIDVGEGRGEGTTLNLPLPVGAGDAAMAAVFGEVIAPAVHLFGPDVILVSAGYDAHYLDQTARLQFTTGTYYRLARDIAELARDVCGGKCCFILEGGYDLTALSGSVVDSFRAFLGEPSSEASRVDNPLLMHEEPSVLVREAIDEVRAIHAL